MIIYNLFPLLTGHMGEWKTHIDRAADMGFNWVFVNPIQKPGMSGSLYSIADYFQINPLFVDPDSTLSAEEQMRQVTQAAEHRGIGMMVDLVINHCAIDSALTKQHPNWFMHEANGAIAHPFCIDGGEKVVWGDLARFDHEHTADPEGLYRYLREIVEYLIGLGFKGFRCDAAYQLPRRLWERLIKDMRNRHEGLIFTAETLGCTADETKETAQAGFDYVFNSSKWWDFNGPWLMAQYQLVREIALPSAFPRVMIPIGCSRKHRAMWMP
ncbi:MAG: alpha-amylase family glycosyl hydrolase [Candidatus Competibacteraceae bacterium]